MKKRVASAVYLFIFLLVSATTSVAESDPARLNKIQALLVEVRGLMSSQAHSLEASSRMFEAHRNQCMKSYSYEKIKADPQSFPLNDTGPTVLKMIDDIRSYYECQAFTRHDPNLCSALPRYQPSNQPNEYESRCRTSYVRSRALQLNVAQRKDALKICESLPFSAEDLHETSVAEECDWMLDKELDDHCKSPISADVAVLDVKDCLAHRVLHPNEKRCAEIKEAPIAEVTRNIYAARCADALAYGKAYRAKDSRRCGDSLVCRMLMGGNVCSQYGERFKSGYCRFLAEKKTAEESSRILQARNSKLDDLFAQIGSMVDGLNPLASSSNAAVRDYNELRRSYNETVRNSGMERLKPSAQPRQSRH